MTRKVDGVVFGVLVPMLSIASSILLLIIITIALIVIDSWLGCRFWIWLGYALITWIARRRLSRNSRHIADEQTQVVKALQEGLGGIRDVLLDGTQQAYCVFIPSRHST